MKKIRVYHSYYGCDTGCCGHIIEIDGERVGRFHFDHPYEEQEPLEFAKKLIESKLGKEHCQDLDWEHAELNIRED
jgi:hypothetical protein